MKLAVSGSRRYQCPGTVFRIVQEFVEIGNYREIIHGGAEGVDTWADQAARHNATPITITVIRPDYKKWAHAPKYAPIARNTEIVEACDTLLVFWDESSPGTRDAMEKAIKAGKKVHVWGKDGKPMERGL